MLSLHKITISVKLAKQLFRSLCSGQYQSVIGLEVHAQISCRSKLFSDANSSYFGAPNSHVQVFDCALPGTLPVLNKRCVEAAILTGLALNCNVEKYSLFDRKHYFYADMPAGYQITQQRYPIATNGFIEFIVWNPNLGSDAYIKRSNLKQIQLEQDSGKSLQDIKNGRSLVDLNRAGVALMEFVFEPDISTADEAICLVNELVFVLKQIDTCSCKMSEGALRVDANISVRKPNQPLGVRTEVKNLNSFNFIHQAIDYEIKRQIDLINNGEQVTNETRMFDSKLKKTFVMRDKEVVQDYRFMPEPNLPPLLLSDDSDCHLNPSLINISSIKRQLPELPVQQRQHFIDVYNLKLDYIFILMKEPAIKQFFVTIFELSVTKKSNEIFKFLNSKFREILEEYKINFVSFNLNQMFIANTIDLHVNGDISMGTAVDIIRLHFNGEKRMPNQLIKDFNWSIIKDPEELKLCCLNTIEKYPKIARKYAKTGKRKPESKLIQDVMLQIDNRADKEQVWTIFDQLLRNNESENKISNEELIN